MFLFCHIFVQRKQTTGFPSYDIQEIYYCTNYMETCAMVYYALHIFDNILNICLCYDLSVVSAVVIVSVHGLFY